MMSIRVEEEHPFAFIQVLEDKEELACIRNRLFRFYRNLLMVMGKWAAMVGNVSNGRNVVGQSEIPHIENLSWYLIFIFYSFIFQN